MIRSRSKPVPDLHHLSPFAGCTRAQLRWARRHLTALEFEGGRVLMEEGGSSREAMLIASGEVVVTRRERAIARLGPGAVVGEIGVLANRRRTASVRTVTPVQAYVASANELFELVAHIPPFARRLLVEVCARTES